MVETHDEGLKVSLDWVDLLVIRRYMRQFRHKMYNAVVNGEMN